MRNVLFKNFLVYMTTALLFVTSVVSSDAVSAEKVVSNGETEYWALLVAVGIYADHPDENRPSMLREVDHLYNTLLNSSFWSQDHIMVIKGEDANVLNILRGLVWLNTRVDGDDVSLVYITTHGFPLYLGDKPIDLPPRDESDGCDEALVTYWGFDRPLAIIWDDELNLFLSLLRSPGVCLIVDSCFSGGFNDPPYWGKVLLNTLCHSTNYDASLFSLEWVKDLSVKGRVVLMSCQEDEVSYGSDFSHYLAEGLGGAADVNVDGVVSAEEAFNYAKDRIGSWQHPTMYDGYPGELPLTRV